MLRNKYFTAKVELQDKDTLSLEDVIFHKDLGPFKCGMKFNVGSMYTFLEHNKCRLEMHTIDYKSTPIKHTFDIL